MRKDPRCPRIMRTPKTTLIALPNNSMEPTRPAAAKRV